MQNSAASPVRRMFWNGGLVLTTAVLFFCSGSPTVVRAADDAAKPGSGDKPKEKNLGQRKEGEVGRNDELSFLQSKVSAQMSELEERMFRLSDALKQLEPENASRLLIGLKYAREELIQLQMKEVQTALSTKKYNDAVTDQKELLAKLRRLEQLLLSPDLDFQLQLERLRLMRDLIRRLDAAIQEEDREKSASEQSADSQDELKQVRKRLAQLKELIQRQTQHNEVAERLIAATSPAEPDANSEPADALNALSTSPPASESETPDTGTADFKALGEEQRETREQAQPLEKKSKDVADAAKSMERATELLSGQKPGDALPYQDQALSLLKKAEDALREKERELEAAISEQKFAEMRKDQSNNRKTTDGISEAAVQLGDSGSAARADLGKASGSMMSAEGSLGSGDADSANDSQEVAADSLKSARAKLAAEADKLLNRLRAEIKKRTIEGIVQMLEGQVTIRQSTERLGPRLKDGGRVVSNSVAALAPAENKLIVIGEGLTSLVEETEFGIALPAALRSVTDGMTEIKDRLAAVDASEQVVGMEKQVEEDLQSLLDAMKQLPSSNGSGEGNRNSRAARERQLNQIIAELKMVRMLQVRVNRDTKDVDGQRPAEAKDLPLALTRRIEALEGRQEDVHDVTERIAIERADDLPQDP